MRRSQPRDPSRGTPTTERRARPGSPAPAAVAETLRARYGDFAHHNRHNPLDELLFILCSTRTQEEGYRNTHAALRREFPTFDRLREAPAEYIARPLAPGGLHNSKSRAIRQICDAICQRFDRLSLAPLRAMDDAQCERFLTSLPGVGRKVARCVMMYSLDRMVFPVDTHCWRIARRLGWVRRTRRDGSCSPADMDRLQAKIPPPLRFSLHVNCLSLGREFCTANNPDCPGCPIAPICPRIGVHTAKSAVGKRGPPLYKRGCGPRPRSERPGATQTGNTPPSATP